MPRRWRELFVLLSHFLSAMLLFMFGCLIYFQNPLVEPSWYIRILEFALLATLATVLWVDTLGWFDRLWSRE